MHDTIQNIFRQNYSKENALKNLFFLLEYGVVNNSLIAK